MNEFKFEPYEFPQYEITEQFYFCTYWQTWIATNQQKADQISMKYKVNYTKLF